MLHKARRYSRPKKLYESSRIAEENKLCARFGLKNKREIWKAQAKVAYYRQRAKDLAQAPPTEQALLFTKLQALGIPVQTTADVLALRVEDILGRRLPTLVFQQGKALTTQQARQFVTHRKVLINQAVVNRPGYLVHKAEEASITVLLAPVIQKKEVAHDKEE
jgi:small subunit ribosomal protein S4